SSCRYRGADCVRRGIQTRRRGGPARLTEDPEPSGRGEIMSQSAAGADAPPAGQPDPDERPAHLSHREILVVLGGLMTGMLLAALDQSIVGTALPRIVSELGGLDRLSWVVTAYLLTSTAATPLWGKISDLYGRRLIFQAAIVTFLVGSALSGAAQNMGELIAFRAVQGLGPGGPSAIALAP